MISSSLVTNTNRFFEIVKLKVVLESDFRYLNQRTI